MQTIYLDISNKGVIPCIQAKQSEVGRKFIAVITDNGVPYNISNNSLLSVWYEGDTDAGNYSSIEDKSAFTVDGNKITVELVAQMLLNPGNGELCLSITHGDGGETNTWNIPYCVEFKPGAGSSAPTEYYTALTQAAAEVAAQVGDVREQANIASESAINASVSANEAKSAAEEAKTAAENAKDAANEAVTDIDPIIAEKVAALSQIFVPVGFTFIWDPVADSNVDLSTAEKVSAHYGFGTWEQIKDTFLLACGDARAVGETGGSETHTLTVDELPSHTHGIKYRSIFAGNGIYSALRRDVSEDPYDGQDQSALATGGDQPFSIMPPYRTFYVWKRIA